MKKIKSFLLLALGLIVTQNVLAAVGDTFTVDGVTYKITGQGNTQTNNANSVSVVSYTGVDVSITINPTIVYKPLDKTRDYTYKITSVAEGAISSNVLNSIDFSKASNLTSIGSGAFDGCTNLTSITVPGSVTTIGENVFAGKTVNIVGNITSTAFANSGVKVINMTSGTSIVAKAFQNCETLESINLPSTLTTINANAFDGCTNLKGNIDFPDLATIGANAFDNTGIASISVNKTTTNAGTSVAQNAFQNYPGKVIVNVATVGNWFSGTTVSQVVLGPKVTRYTNLENYTGEVVVQCATKTDMFNVSKTASYKMSSLVVDVESATEEGAFRKIFTQGLSITISERVQELGNKVFEQSTIEEITIPGNLVTVPQEAFWGCKQLTTATICEGVKYLQKDVFSQCENLKNVTLPSSLETIGWGVFYNTAIESIDIPDGVTSIGQHSFSGCANLQEVTIPSSVTTMAPEVFQNSSSLETVVIDAQISTLPSGTFSGCTGLTNITLPATLTQINKDDFKDCTKLTNVTLNSLPEGLENLPNGVTITLELSDDKGLNDIQNVTKTVAISYTRSINASTNWGSLVLPFDCTSNDDIQLYQFAGADLDKGFIKFEEVESVAANTPCFFKKKISNATSVSFNATLSGGFSVGITPSTSEGWTMTGSYARTTINSNEYFISSDKLYYANSNVTMKPFRGWLVAPANAAASLRTLTIQIVETDATGVEHIVNETEINEQDIYDLFGRHLTTPQRGINIVNGKKVMVK